MSRSDRGAAEADALATGVEGFAAAGEAELGVDGLRRAGNDGAAEATEEGDEGALSGVDDSLADAPGLGDEGAAGADTATGELETTSPVGRGGVELVAFDVGGG